MPDMHTPVREFIEPSAEALASVKLHEPAVGEDYFMKSSGGKRHLVVYGDPEADHVVFDATAYSVDNTAKIDRLRSGVFANTAEVMVVGLSVPGFNRGYAQRHELGGFTDEQATALKRGDWRPFAKESWDLIHAAVSDYTGQADAITDKKVHFDGHSQGVSVNSAMLAEMPTNYSVGEFIAWEGVALKRPGMARLMGRFILSGIDWQLREYPQFKEERAQLPKTIPGADEKFKGNIMNPLVIRALANGNDTEVLRAALHNRHSVNDMPTLHMWYERNSRMKTALQTERAARSLASEGIANVLLVAGNGGHGSEDFLARGIALKTAALRGEVYFTDPAVA